MNCENCLVEHDGSYASGRFCRSNCARSFAAKVGGEPVKARKRATLLSKRECVPERSCEICGKSFVPIYRRRAKSICSASCAGRKTQARPEIKANLSRARIAAIQAGKTNHKSIRCMYMFKGSEVRCDSKLEYACLDWFERHYQVTSIARVKSAVPYDDGGVSHLYLPDFLITTSGGAYIVECKGQIYTQSLQQKWHRYRESAPLKKAALEAFALENGLIPFWFEPTTEGSRYRKISSAEVRATNQT